MANNELDLTINCLWCEITALIEEIDYQNQDFVCETCLDTKDKLLNLLSLIEILEEELK